MRVHRAVGTAQLAECPAVVCCMRRVGCRVLHAACCACSALCAACMDAKIWYNAGVYSLAACWGLVIFVGHSSLHVWSRRQAVWNPLLYGLVTQCTITNAVLHTGGPRPLLGLKTSATLRGPSCTTSCHVRANTWEGHVGLCSRCYAFGRTWWSPSSVCQPEKWRTRS